MEVKLGLLVHVQPAWNRLLLCCPLTKTTASESVAGQDCAFLRYSFFSGGLVATCCAET